MMALVEGWLVLTPKKHVYFYSESHCDPHVMELPWNCLEKTEELADFLNNFDLSAPDVIDEIIEVKIEIDQEKLADWFKQHSQEPKFADFL